MTTYGGALSDTLNATSQEHISVFLAGLKDIFAYSESLILGQHTLFGNFKILEIKITFVFYSLLFKDLGLKTT